MTRTIRRGDIYRVVLDDAQGHETTGPHYAIVVQADLYNVLSTVLAVPLSSSVKRPAPFHVPLQVSGKKTYALVEQLRTLDTQRRLREFIVNIAGTGTMAQIDHELKLILGLHEDYRLL